ncbi:hypothetical protein EV361DRAFT_997350, partial [Lentinula raphanica]
IYGDFSVYFVKFLQLQLDVNAITKEEHDTGKPAKPPKTHVKVSDVPFVQSSDQTVWNNKVRTGLIEWSGSVSKQFNINSDPNFRETVMDLWNRHLNTLPHIPLKLKYNGSTIQRSEHPAILSFAQADIRNYRSNVGKMAVRALRMYLTERADTFEEQRELVEELLHHNAFVYEKLGKMLLNSEMNLRELSEVNSSCTPMHSFSPGVMLLLVSTTQSFQLVLRALEVSRSNTEPASPADFQTMKKKKPANSPDNFGDQWGPQAAKFYNDILKLNVDKWELITETSAGYIHCLPNAGSGPYLKEARRIQEILADKRKGKQPEVQVEADDEIIVSD